MIIKINSEEMPGIKALADAREKRETPIELIFDIILCARIMLEDELALEKQGMSAFKKSSIVKNLSRANMALDILEKSKLIVK